MTREEILNQMDINGPGIHGPLFGLPFSPDTAHLVIIPVPWEATVSYHTGTAGGPEAIVKASAQVDFFLREIPDAWKMGIALSEIPGDIKAESDRLRILVDHHRAAVKGGGGYNTVISSKINEACESMNIYVKQKTQYFLNEGKLVGLLGGDHSTPLGFMRALGERHARFGILQIDAHADLRKAYEGFTYSHGSVMYNAMKIPSVSKLVQVGVRDLCDEEYQMINRNRTRITTFFDEDLKVNIDTGKSWEKICTEIIHELPENVYLSFDIDGLDPKLCPNTGTPVPGGLSFHQAVTLIKTIATARKIIGFDLNEIGTGNHDDWDANVGSRILWQLCNWMGVSNNLLHYLPSA